MEFDDPDVDGDESASETASETAKSYQPRKNFAPISNASLTRTQTTARRTKASRSKPPSRNIFAHGLTPYWLTACLLLALLSSFWAKGTTTNRPLLYKPIELVRVGDRIVGRNPLREQVEGVEPDPATCARSVCT